MKNHILIAIKNSKETLSTGNVYASLVKFEFLTFLRRADSLSKGFQFLNRVAKSHNVHLPRLTSASIATDQTFLMKKINKIKTSPRVSVLFRDSKLVEARRVRDVAQSLPSFARNDQPIVAATSSRQTVAWNHSQTFLRALP